MADRYPDTSYLPRHPPPGMTSRRCLELETAIAGGADRAKLRRTLLASDAEIAAVERRLAEHAPQPRFRIDQWILSLISALDHHDRTLIGVAANRDGHGQSMVVCRRCPSLPHPVPFLVMVRHVREVEDNYRRLARLGPNAAAHGPGDIEPVLLVSSR